MPKVSKRNRLFAERIRDLVKKYKIVGVVDVTGLPAPQFQEIRRKLKGRAEVLIVKKNIVRIVLTEFNKHYKNISELSEYLSGVCGLIFTNENPFKIYKFIQQNKSSAPAKPGQVAPRDIVVKAGPTSFAPGPIIGELGSLKIKAGIEGGKVVIKEDALVAKEGEVISPKLAEILTRLDIKPMEVGLNIKAIYEDGLIYKRDVLEVDESYYLDMLKSAASESYALTLGMGYVTSDNIRYFIGNSFNEAMALAVGTCYISEESALRVLGKVYSEAVALAMALPEDVRPEEVASVAASSETGAISGSSEGSSESKEEKKEESEEDVAAGLGSLFG